MCQKISVAKELIFDGESSNQGIHLILRVNYVDSSEKFVKLYPDLFTGSGTLGMEYHIQLRHDAKPYALTSCFPTVT